MTTFADWTSAFAHCSSFLHRLQSQTPTPRQTNPCPFPSHPEKSEARLMAIGVPHARFPRTSISTNRCHLPGAVQPAGPRNLSRTTHSMTSISKTFRPSYAWSLNAGIHTPGVPAVRKPSIIPTL